MKKIIFLWGILLPITSSFAFTINPTPTNIEDTAKNGILYLDNGKNTFNKSTSHTNQIQLDQEKNNFKCSSCTFDNITNPLYITCKNGLISKIQGHANHTPNYILTGNFQSLILDYNYSGHEYKSNIILQCKPITQPTKIIESEVLDINYKTIQTPKNNPFESLVLSTSIDPEIDPNKLKKLEPGKEPDSQPTFTDILFLQLKTISNLSDAILTQHPDLSFSGLFTSNTNFENYNKWLDKFSTFSIKTEFEDAFSGAITLKDIGIANNIVKGLYICATSNNCSSVIKFKHSILDKYDPYKFKEIENDIYSGTNNILNASINYYTNLKNICSNTNVGDTFLNTQISSICSKLLSDQIDTNNIENYDLGYSLGIRINNLQKIKDGINPKEGINLKGIFNIYWELNNLTLGTNKLTKVKKVIEEPSLTGKYEELKEIFKIDLKEIENKKIDDNEYKQILETNVNILSPNNTILKTIKEENPTLDITDKKNFQIIRTNNGGNTILSRGINVNLSNISSLKDLAGLSEYSDKVKIIFKESNGTYKNSLGFYEEDDGKPTKGEIKIKNVKLFNKGEKIYEGKIKKGLFIVSNGNINGNIGFEYINTKIGPFNTSAFVQNFYKSKYKTKNKKRNYSKKICMIICIKIKRKDGYTPIFFDNPLYNYHEKQQFKIEIFSGYALVRIEDMYNGNNDYNDIILKVIPKKDD